MELQKTKNLGGIILGHIGLAKNQRIALIDLMLNHYLKMNIKTKWLYYFKVAFLLLLTLKVILSISSNPTYNF